MSRLIIGKKASHAIVAINTLAEIYQVLSSVGHLEYDWSISNPSDITSGRFEKLLLAHSQNLSVNNKATTAKMNPAVRTNIIGTILHLHRGTNLLLFSVSIGVPLPEMINIAISMAAPITP